MIIRLFYSISDEVGFNGNEQKLKVKSSKGIVQDASQEKSTCSVTCSELLMGEQILSECEKAVRGQDISHLTFLQYNEMNSEQRGKVQNRVRQWALKARDVLPSDHGIFCLVVAHLLKCALLLQNG